MVLNMIFGDRVFHRGKFKFDCEGENYIYKRAYTHRRTRAEENTKGSRNGSQGCRMHFSSNFCGSGDVDMHTEIDLKIKI